MEIPNPPDKEFKVIVMKIFIRVERRVDELRTSTKDREYKKEPIKLKNTINEKYTRGSQE